MKTRFSLILLILSGLFGCNDLTVGQEPANTPEQNFDRLWQTFDRMYGLFAVKNVDWNKQYQTYRPLVNRQTTDEQLFTIMSHMLGELNDGHVWLITPKPNARRYDSGPTYPTGDFSLPTVKRYLQDIQETTAEGSTIIQGKSGAIGYLHLPNFGQNPAYYEHIMDTFLNTMADAKGIIIDVRNLDGGIDKSAQHVAGRFARITELYMTSRTRNGAGHTDFTASTKWFVQPTGKSQFTKPVILLTNRLTQSAGETFTLAMRQLPNVTHVGDTTFGIFSENPHRELPNGWLYTVSAGDYRAADGKSYEGVGLTPTIVVQNQAADVAAGKDRALEKALTALAGK